MDGWLLLVTLWRIIFAASDLPLYWAWFLNDEDSSQYVSTARQLLADSLAEVPEFLQDVTRFTGLSSIDDICNYYSREGLDRLHCTTMYNGVYPNYTQGAQEYADRKSVRVSDGQPFTIHTIGWLVTPRTFGARLRLTKNQLILWNQDDNEGHNSTGLPQQPQYKCVKPAPITEGIITVPQDADILGNFKPTSGLGSRAHLTIGCAPNVSAVATGTDLVDIVYLEQAAGKMTPTYLTTKSWLRNYGEGRWVIYPTTQDLIPTTFIGFSPPVK